MGTFAKKCLSFFCSSKQCALSTNKGVWGGNPGKGFDIAEYHSVLQDYMGWMQNTICPPVLSRTGKANWHCPICQLQAGYKRALGGPLHWNLPLKNPLKYVKN
jgi:hypothetical protein